MGFFGRTDPAPDSQTSGRTDTESLALCARSLQNAQRQASAEPDRVDYQRKLSAEHKKVGDLQRRLGMAEAALESYARSAQIAQRMTVADPDRVDFKRKLATAYDELGDLQRELGKGAAAVDSYTRSMRIAQHLVAAESEHPDNQRRLRSAHSRLGRLAAGMGDPAAGHAHYSADLRIARRLLVQQPGSANATVDLAGSLTQMAGVAVDPARYKVEAAAILRQLHDERRLTKRGATLLAALR